MVIKGRLTSCIQRLLLDYWKKFCVGSEQFVFAYQENLNNQKDNWFLSKKSNIYEYKDLYSEQKVRPGTGIFPAVQ